MQSRTTILSPQIFPTTTSKTTASLGLISDGTISSNLVDDIANGLGRPPTAFSEGWRRVMCGALRLPANTFVGPWSLPFGLAAGAGLCAFAYKNNLFKDASKRTDGSAVSGEISTLRRQMKFLGYTTLSLSALAAVWTVGIELLHDSKEFGKSDNFVMFDMLWWGMFWLGDVKVFFFSRSFLKGREGYLNFSCPQGKCHNFLRRVRKCFFLYFSTDGTDVGVCLRSWTIHQSQNLFTIFFRNYRC